MTIVFWVLALVSFFFVMSFIKYIGQSVDDYREEIIKELESRNLELLEIQIPKLFDTGPFPKFGFKIGPSTKINGTSGEKLLIRRVRYRDSKGNEKESWVKIETTAFIFVEMKWIPKLK